jgi:hypothetical protein
MGICFGLSLKIDTGSYLSWLILGSSWNREALQLLETSAGHCINRYVSSSFETCQEQVENDDKMNREHFTADDKEF